MWRKLDICVEAGKVRNRRAWNCPEKQQGVLFLSQFSYHLLLYIFFQRIICFCLLFHIFLHNKAGTDHLTRYIAPCRWIVVTTVAGVCVHMSISRLWRRLGKQLAVKWRTVLWIKMDVHSVMALYALSCHRAVAADLSGRQRLYFRCSLVRQRRSQFNVLLGEQAMVPSALNSLSDSQAYIQHRY